MARAGIDFGGHTLVAASVEQSCMDRAAITQIVRRDTPHGRGVAECIAAVADAVASLGETFESVGFALPSMIGADRRRVGLMPNFPREWIGVDAADALARALADRGVVTQVRVENDANCYALGEGAAGAARGLSDYVVFTMGTGIGCGIVAGGRLFTGAHGMAGEGGHIVIDGDAECGCGGHGHAETLAAADGMRARAEDRGLPGDLRDLWPMRGTPEADAVLGVTIDAMARTTASAVHLLDPQAVIIGGGMSAAPGLVEAIAERTRHYLSAPFVGSFEILRSTLGEKAPLYGAAML